MNLNLHEEITIEDAVKNHGAQLGMGNKAGTHIAMLYKWLAGRTAEGKVYVSLAYLDNANSWAKSGINSETLDKIREFVNKLVPLEGAKQGVHQTLKVYGGEPPTQEEMDKAYAALMG